MEGIVLDLKRDAPKEVLQGPAARSAVGMAKRFKAQSRLGTARRTAARPGTIPLPYALDQYPPYSLEAVILCYRIPVFLYYLERKKAHKD